MPVEAPEVRRRLPAHRRRAQLLDTAAALVVARGTSGFTMERLAEQAGVSKAIPYRHFRDADATLVALYRRETAALGAAVTTALESAPPGADAVRVSVRAYFDALLPKREVLAALSPPGGAIPALADPEGVANRFAAGLLQRFHGLDRSQAQAVAGMVQGATVGASATFLAGLAPRRRIEDDLVRMINAVLAP